MSELARRRLRNSLTSKNSYVRHHNQVCPSMACVQIEWYIPPSEGGRSIDILPYTPEVKNSHTQPKVKNSHTPHEAAGRGWSMGILHRGLSMGILYRGCIRKNIYNPLDFGGGNDILFFGQSFHIDWTIFFGFKMFTCIQKTVICLLHDRRRLEFLKEYAEFTSSQFSRQLTLLTETNSETKQYCKLDSSPL